jgi:hypothetical protein
MALHLLPIMSAALAFMLWIAFQGGDETDLTAGEPEEQDESGVRSGGVA